MKDDPTAKSPNYFGAETKALRRVLRMLTADQRARYVDACKSAARHRNGKLYDTARQRIAEEIIYKDRMRGDG